MKTKRRILAAVVLMGILIAARPSVLSGPMFAAEQALDEQPSIVFARDAQELRRAVAQAKPGTRIHLAPGTYPGGFYFPNLRGEPGRPIVIAAEDPKNPPVIQGASEGINLARAAYVELLKPTTLSFSAATSGGTAA